MARTITKPGRLIEKTREFTRQARSTGRRALGLKPRPKTTISSILGHLRDPETLESLLLITDTMQDDHRERVMQDLDNDRLSPLTRYVTYMAFLESVSLPVRPLSLHPQLGDWLLALPDEQDCYYPADPCWDCGYRYPGTAGILPVPNHNATTPRDRKLASAPSFAAPPVAVSPADPHPWAGRRCLYCQGEIVDHLEWLAPNSKRTLSDLQNAPHRRKQQSTAHPGDPDDPESARYKTDLEWQP